MFCQEAGSLPVGSLFPGAEAANKGSLRGPLTPGCRSSLGGEDAHLQVPIPGQRDAVVLLCPLLLPSLCISRTRESSVRKGVVEQEEFNFSSFSLSPFLLFLPLSYFLPQQAHPQSL